MILKRHKQLATIWLALAAALYAVVCFAVQYSVIEESWSAFSRPGAWDATVLMIATGAMVIAPVLVAYLAYRGVRSWWLILLLAGSMFVVPSILVGMAIVAVVIWLVDRSDRVAA
jgi:hypothetical protein